MLSKKLWVICIIITCSSFINACLERAGNFVDDNFCCIESQEEGVMLPSCLPSVIIMSSSSIAKLLICSLTIDPQYPDDSSAPYSCSYAWVSSCNQSYQCLIKEDQISDCCARSMVWGSTLGLGVSCCIFGCMCLHKYRNRAEPPAAVNN